MNITHFKAIKQIDMKAFLLVAAMLISAFSSNGQSPQDKEAVKNVVIAFQDDFNEGSFKNAETYSTPDWRHINPGGGIDKGRDSVLQTVRAVHQTFLKGVTMRIGSIDIRFLNNDVAIADVIHQVDNYTTPDGIIHENNRHIKTYVVVKKRGNWLLAHDHATAIQSSNSVINRK